MYNLIKNATDTSKQSALNFVRDQLPYVEDKFYPERNRVDWELLRDGPELETRRTSCQHPNRALRVYSSLWHLPQESQLKTSRCTLTELLYKNKQMQMKHYHLYTHGMENYKTPPKKYLYNTSSGSIISYNTTHLGQQHQALVRRPDVCSMDPIPPVTKTPEGQFQNTWNSV